MKKFLLTITAFVAVTLYANAQTQRMSLVEEFTGENCDPCAEYNPAYWSLMNTAPNPSEIIQIAYMEPIPSSGWFYLQDQAVSDTRIGYYQTYFNWATGTAGEEFTPADVRDGLYTDATASGGAMNIADFVQADIDSMHGVSSPFILSVTNSWDGTYTNIISVVTITNASSSTTYAPAGANFYLRLAMVETVDFATPPGTNGESHFQHVVRAMFPNATGTTLPESWAPGASQTFTVTGACPSYVDKSKSPFMVAWVQNDNDMTIQQAAQATPLPGVANDAAILAAAGPSGINCEPNAPYSFTHTVALQNAGSGTMTFATIYYSIDAGALTSYAWSGSLAATSSTSVTMPSASVTVTGAYYHTIYDSVAMPNGSTDLNPINNPASNSFFIESTVGLPMPYYTSFENDEDSFYAESLSADGANWGFYTNGTGASLAHTGVVAGLFDCYDFPTGDQAILTFPEVTTTSAATLSFWVAYAQYSGTENDQLEVVYSSDCGSTWTSLWSAAGTALATASPTEDPFTPTSSQYVQHTVSLSSVPAGSIIAFRGTSDYGNDMWVDDININATTGVNQITQSSLAANIYPNPAKDEATLTFNLNEAANVQIQVLNTVGQVVAVVANDKMNVGEQSVVINTASLSSGMYNVVINTGNGSFNERLSVIK